MFIPKEIYEWHSYSTWHVIKTITNIVIFTQNKKPRFWSILEKQVNYICLEYKKILSLRTSLQAAIVLLHTPWLPPMGVHTPYHNKRNCVLSCAHACCYGAHGTKFILVASDSSNLQIFKSSMFEYITEVFKQ